MRAHATELFVVFDPFGNQIERGFVCGVESYTIKRAVRE